MIINCFRCGVPLDSPNETTADYVIASDMIADEEVEVLEVLQHNAKTKNKAKKGEPILEVDWTIIEIDNIKDKDSLPEVALVRSNRRFKSIQKTGIICPDDYLPTDRVIWGVHKRRTDK